MTTIYASLISFLLIFTVYAIFPEPMTNIPMSQYKQLKQDLQDAISICDRLEIVASNYYAIINATPIITSTNISIADIIHYKIHIENNIKPKYVFSEFALHLTSFDLATGLQIPFSGLKFITGARLQYITNRLNPDLFFGIHLDF